jgi:hypothetical protein
MEIFARVLKFSTNLSVAQRLGWGWIFLQVGFGRIILIDQVIIHAGS